MSNPTVLAYPTPEEASRAVDYLMERGITTKDISVLMSDKTHELHFKVQENTKATEGVGVGATVGGALGAIGATAAAAAGLAIPGIGFLAAGPIMTALAGAGAGAATGGLVGGLSGLGVPEHEAKLYQDTVKDGGVLVGVDANDATIDALKEKTAPIRVS